MHFAILLWPPDFVQFCTFLYGRIRLTVAVNLVLLSQCMMSNKYYFLFLLPFYVCCILQVQNDCFFWLFRCQLQRLLRELDSVSKQLAVVKRDQEAEAMMRHDCENRIKNLQSELSLKERVHRKVQRLNCLLQLKGILWPKM